jgi:molecular chaperone DnaJ
VKPHEYFKRQGTDILYDLPISYVDAAMGAELEVPTLDGKEAVKVPSGTQSGRTFRLKGKGVPVIHSQQKGDELVTVKVVTPQSLTPRQRELLREFGEIEKQQNERGAHNLFDRIKDAMHFE